MFVSDWMKENAVCQWACSLWKRWGKAFVRLYVYTVVVYLPLIVLRLTNCLDGMWDQDDHLAGTAELRIGRWFWPYLDRLRFGVSLDPIPALISIALYVTGILVLISMLRGRGAGAVCAAGVGGGAAGACGTSPGKLSLVEYLCAALMLTTPAVLCQLSYSYMSITFSMGFLFSVLAVWVIAVPCVKAVAGGAADSQSHGQVAASCARDVGCKAEAQSCGQTADPCAGSRDGAAHSQSYGQIAASCARDAGCKADVHSRGLSAVSSAEAVEHQANEETAAKKGRQTAKKNRPAALARQIFWILLSALLIALMMGLYQAFLGVTCIAALAFFIYQLDGTCGGANCCIKKAFVFVLRMLLALAVGAVLYQILLQVHLTVMGQTMSSYNGADSVSVSGILSALPSSIRQCLRVFKIYFLDTMFLSNALQLSGKVYYLLYLVPAAGVVLYIVKLVHAGKGWIRVILLLLAGLLIPVFATSFFLLATDSDTMMQMTSGLSLVLPLILLAWDRVDLPGTARTAKSCPAAAADPACTGAYNKKEANSVTETMGSNGACADIISAAAGSDNHESEESSSDQESCTVNQADGGEAQLLQGAVTKDSDTAPQKGLGTRRTRIGTNALGIAVAIGAFLMLYGQIGQMEIDQYAMYAGRRATTTLAESVLNEYAVYGVDYQNSVVMVYGAPADSPTFVVGDLYYNANSYAQYGNWGNTEDSNRLCWYYFFRQQMRVKLNYAEGDTLYNTMTSELVQAMTVFPASGSVQNVWGVTVVKVAE